MEGWEVERGWDGNGGEGRGEETDGVTLFRLFKRRSYSSRTSCSRGVTVWWALVGEEPVVADEEELGFCERGVIVWSTSGVERSQIVRLRDIMG